MNGENRTHSILLFILAIIFFGVGAGVIFIRSQATNVTLEVNNSAPTVSGSKLCVGSTASTNAGISACSDIPTVTLTAGSALDVSYVAQVTDSNGTNDLAATATGVLYHDENASPASESCSADNNDCYRDDAECYKITPEVSSVTAWYRCDFSLEYYTDDTADSGDWTSYMIVEDAAEATGTDGHTFEVAKLVAGTFPDVEYGPISLGFVSGSGDNIEVTHQNEGNVLLDYTIALDDDDANSELDCATGGIGNSLIRFDTDNGGGDEGYAAAAKTITVAPTTIDMEIDISQRTNDSAVQGPTNPRTSFGDGGDDAAYSYWSISVPSTGILGACQEEIDITAFESGTSSVCWTDVASEWNNQSVVSLGSDGQYVNTLNAAGFPAGTYTEVDGGYDGFCGISTSGDVECWNNAALNGYPTTGTWTQVEVGNGTACAIDDSGNITCWGDDSFNEVTDTPSGSGYKDIAAGLDVNCAIDSSDNVECWGRDAWDQITNAPSGSYTDISCGRQYCVGVVQSTGALTVWGSPSVTDIITNKPSATGFVSVSAGKFNAGALTSAGALTMWGNDQYDVITNTPAATSWSVVEVTAEGACGIVDDATGSSLGDGEVQCWGNFSESSTNETCPAS